MNVSQQALQLQREEMKTERKQISKEQREAEKERMKLTTVYFVRHAEPNYNNHDDVLRELSPKGLEDRKKVTQFLNDKDIDVVLSSPFKRAIDTVKEFSDSHGLELEVIDDFCERKISHEWIEDFSQFARKQWEDFSYKLSDGECLQEVQQRNIEALQLVLDKYKGKNIVVGSHGTALSTMINYYDRSFGYLEFDRIKKVMPWVVEFRFDEDGECVGIVEHAL